MKVFFTWMIDPEDPKIWKHFNVDGILVSLSSMLRGKTLDRLTYLGFKRTYKYQGILIVDSLTKSIWSNGKDFERQLGNILVLQLSLGADYVIHRDYPLINKLVSEDEGWQLLRKNLKAAEIYLDTAKRLGIEVITVAHGWDAASYAWSAERLAAMGSKYIAIGSLLPLVRRKRTTIIDIVRAVREIVGPSIKIHVLGVFSPTIVAELRNMVDSIDTSSHVRAASAREVYYLAKNSLQRAKISRLGYSMLVKNAKGDRLLEEFLSKIFSSQDFVSMKYWLAVYNAYTIMKFVSL